jgi:hypothetical protein
MTERWTSCLLLAYEQDMNTEQGTFFMSLNIKGRSRRTKTMGFDVPVLYQSLLQLINIPKFSELSVMLRYRDVTADVLNAKSFKWAGLLERIINHGL